MKLWMLATALSLGGLGVTSLPAQVVSKPKPPVGVPADAVTVNGKWYRVYIEKLTWHGAREKCLRLKGQLAVVPDAATWEVLKTLSPASLWLGATDEEAEGIWKWVDGTPFNFTAWVKNTPNNVDGKEHYLMTLTKDGFQGWGDIGREGKHQRQEVAGFLCEWKGQ